ncbi:MAG: molecular chaperone DnaJ [Alphaproteobacteria bacterium]|nr:molecular chaperone DnaJ [Alphaproteobacteria bacterium]
MADRDLYEILGVAKGASDADIKKAYHKLVMKHHPDKNPGDKTSETKFKEISNAYDILRDKQKRAAYDQFGDKAFKAGGAGGNPFGQGFGGGAGFEGFDFGGAGFGDMFEDIMANMGFGGRGAGQGGRRARQANTSGRDLLHEVRVSLKDAFRGKTVEVKFNTNVKCEKCAGHGTANSKAADECPSCHGSGSVRKSNGFFAFESECPDCSGMGKKIDKKCTDCQGDGTKRGSRTIQVKIPAGVSTGARLRVAGQGEAGSVGGASGDLYVDVIVDRDPHFSRDGNDLLVNLSVSFATLALGGSVSVKGIDGEDLDVKIPSGTQVGSKLRLKGKGMPEIGRANIRGDLYLNIKTEIPTKLSAKQKELLEKFAKEKSAKGFF